MAFVVLLFLQNWRSALIPLVAVPVAIIGTFAVMAAMGFNLNNLTLFGLVLAIGIVVDDAIVVVEAVEHHVEHGMEPRAATIRAMDEVSGPVIAIGLVLSAVFVPCAFITGIVGQFFRQFALTIATSTLISAFNSLTLSPALAALLIKPNDPLVRKNALPRVAYLLAGGIAGFALLLPLVQGQFWNDLSPLLGQEGGPRFRLLEPLASGRSLEVLTSYLGLEGDRAVGIAATVVGASIGWVLGWGIDRALVWFFGVFNAGFRLATAGYSRIVSLFLRGSVAALIIYGGLLYLTYDKFQKTPSGFIPTQDMGYLLCNIQLPDSASLERTKRVMDETERIARGYDLRLISSADNVSEIPRGGMNQVVVAAVGPSLHVRIFDSDARMVVDEDEGGIKDKLERVNDGYELRLMPWGDGSGVPASGSKLVIVGTDNNGLLHIRIFDETGNKFTDMDDTKLPANQAGAILTLKRRLPGLLPPHVLIDAEKAPLIREATSIVVQTLNDLKKKLGRLSPPHELSGREKFKFINQVTSIVGHERALGTGGIRFTQAVTGQSLLLSANGSNFGSMFCILDPFDERREPELYSEKVIANLRKRFADEIPEAVITVLGPPPVRGVGRAGGFKLMVEDRGDNKLSTLQGQTDNLVQKAKDLWLTDANAMFGRGKPLPPEERKKLRDEGKNPDVLTSMVATFRANVPQYSVDVNRAECMTKEVALKDLFDTLRINLGSLYVNDFNRFGRTWQVIIQADDKFRNAIEYVPRLKVRNARGTMVPVGTLASITPKNGPLVLTRYNTRTAAPINGAAAPGQSSGEAIAAMQALSNQVLLNSMSTEWTELAFLELQAGSTAMIVFGFAVVMVFLVLAAQYESWSMPLAIILVVPMCLLSSVLGVRTAGEDINIFTQIGFVVLVGLASKNAILIVEFAKKRRDAGESRRQATLEACTLRLRPIVMTSFAFILGVLPLLTGHGAGAEMRRTLGTTVFSGMLGVTIFGIFLTPVFFYVIDWLGETRFFASPIVRRIAGFPLAILSLQFLRRSGRLSGRRSAKPAPLPELEPDTSTVAVEDRVGELVEQK